MGDPAVGGQTGQPRASGGVAAADSGAGRSSAQSSAGLSSLGASMSGSGVPGQAPRWLGKRVGRFRLVSVLGKGSYGRVFLAEDVDLQRRVALKVITADAAARSLRDQAASAGVSADGSKLGDAIAEAVERMIREARAAARIEHPNVVHVYEIGRLDGSGLGGFIAMELLDGGTLQDLLRATGPLDVARACALIADAADALQHGHDLGVIHRDVKPANLMLSRAGRCKVADFGLACVDDPNESRRHLAFAGTALYLAPEIMAGAMPDPKTDQYSLAVTLFTLLAGRPPYTGTRREVLEQHVRAPIPDLRVVRPDVDPKLFDVIRRGMSKDPGKRFPNIRQFGQALRLFTVATAPMPSAYEAPPPPVQETIFDDVLAEAAQGPAIEAPVMYAPRKSSLDMNKVVPLAIGGGIVAMLLMLVLILWAAGAFSGPEQPAQLAQLPPIDRAQPSGESIRGEPQRNDPPPRQPTQQTNQAAQPVVEEQPPVQQAQAQPKQQDPTPPQQQQQQASGLQPPPGLQPPAQGGGTQPGGQPGGSQAAGAGTASKAPDIKLGPGEIAATDYRNLVRVAMGYDTERVTKRAVVVGRVAKAETSETGKVFKIIFQGAEGDRAFEVVYFPDNNLYTKMADKFGGKNGAGLTGKTIRVTGTVGIYENDPQIVVDSPDQIEIVP